MTKWAFKTLCVFNFLLLILLCACNSYSEDYDIKTDFTAEFKASYRNAQYSGSVSNNRQGLTYISISSPKELEGIGFSYKSGELEMSRKELVCSADEAYLPQKSFPSLVRSIMNGVSQGREEMLSNDDSSRTYRIKTDSGECLLNTDLDGNILCAEMKDAELKIEFTKIKATEN